MASWWPSGQGAPGIKPVSDGTSGGLTAGPAGAGGSLGHSLRHILSQEGTVSVLGVSRGRLGGTWWWARLWAPSEWLCGPPHRPAGQPGVGQLQVQGHAFQAVTGPALPRLCVVSHTHTCTHTHTCMHEAELSRAHKNPNMERSRDSLSTYYVPEPWGVPERNRGPSRQLGKARVSGPAGVAGLVGDSAHGLSPRARAWEARL